MRILPVPPEGFQWIVSRTGCATSDKFRAIAAVDGAGVIKGMVALDGWTENAVGMHFALDAPIALRPLLQSAFDWVFNQCGKGLALATIPASNARSLKVAQRIGFEQAHRIADGWAPGVDLVLLQMRRETCKYLN